MSELAFLVDVDNTLLDNDKVKEDLRGGISELVGPERAERFWGAYEETRRDRDFVDFPRTLERFRAAFPEEPRFPQLAALVLFYPYEASRYPGALEAVRHLKTFGRVAIVSDGDPVFQPAKIARAGFAETVDDVIVTVHKERELEGLVQRIGAARHVLVDDKRASSLRRSASSGIASRRSTSARGGTRTRRSTTITPRRTSKSTRSRT